MPSARVKQAIAAFEKAVVNRTFSYLTPTEEGRTILEHNYIKARAKLERLMENL